MEKRMKLHPKLTSIMAGHKVYFNPRDSLKIEYPCILYKITGISPVHADNIAYTVIENYEITLIDTSPESAYIKPLLELTYCSFVRAFVVDNLYHWVFEINIP